MSAANNTSTPEDVVIDPVAHARFPVMVSVYIPTFLVSEVGNGFVIYSLAYLKRSQRTAIDCYILNLAIADILITTFSLLNGTEYLYNAWRLGEAMCKVHGQLMETCYTVSTLTLLAISYNRRKVVGGPLKILDAKKTLKRNIVLIWLTAIALTSPLVHAYTVAKRNGRFHCSNTNFDETARQIYYVLQAVILFFLPVSVMILSQRKITKGLRQHSLIYSRAMDCRDAHWKTVMSHERKISKFLTWIWVVFVCCFTPFILLRTVDHFTSIRKRNEIWNQVWHASQLLALINSAVNPFLYYRSTNRNGSNVSRIVRLLCCIRKKTNVNCVHSSKQQLRDSSRASYVINLVSKSEKT